MGSFYRPILSFNNFHRSTLQWSCWNFLQHSHLSEKLGQGSRGVLLDASGQGLARTGEGDRRRWSHSHHNGYLLGGWPTPIYKWMIWMVYGGKYHENMDDDWEILLGGWPTPLKNDGVSNSWSYEVPNIWKVIKNDKKNCSKPPTSNQSCLESLIVGR